MKIETKQRIAVALLERHADVFDVKIPAALVEFFKTGEVFTCEALAPKLSVPGWEPGTYQLAAMPPSWDAATLMDLDDAVVGDEGEWEHAGEFVPVFHVADSSYIVVKIDDPKCPVGFFEEETFREEGDGYEHGVFMLGLALGPFRSTLSRVAEPDYETHVDDEVWEEIAEELEDEDDDEDDEDDDDDDEDE